jgi:S1-C subfamily serine protease
VKEYLSRQSIPFKEVDVSTDRHGAEEMVRISGQQGVPVTVVDGQVIVGFDRERLEHVLARARRPRLGAAAANAAEIAAKGMSVVKRGAFVGRVTPGGAAARAGLQPGDVIVSLAGQKIDGATDLERVMAGLQFGQNVPLAYVRGYEQFRTSITF